MADKFLEVPSLNDLDDNVLIAVMKRLPIDALCTMKGVCTRFQHLTKKTFKRQHANHIAFNNPIENIRETTRIIKCFGQFIKSITIEGSLAFDLNTSTLQLIDRYCGPKLKKLRLICVHLDKPTFAIMKLLVPKLSIIELLFCKVDTDVRGVNHSVLLKSAANLKELVIIGGNQDIDLKFLNQTWPALEKLEVISSQIIDEYTFGQSLKKNRQLKYFSYLPNAPSQRHTPWMKSFDSYAPHLEELSIELNRNIEYDQLFKDSTKLRRIVISSNGYNKPIHKLMDILAKIKTLEVLSLWNVDFREFLTLPKLNNIKTLELRQMESVFECKFLAHQLGKDWSNVENLYLDHTIVRSADDMGLFIENVKHLKRLFLCNMKTFFLLPTKEQYESWCSNRNSKLHIFIDSRYLMQHRSTDLSQPIVFHSFKDQLSQTVNVISSTSLN